MAELKRLSPLDSGPKKEVGNPADRQNLPLWERKMEVLRRSRTTPRDLYDFRITDFKFNNPEAERHVRLSWRNIDDMKARRKLGFPYQIFSPVTDVELKEFGLEVTANDRTPEGTVLAGIDAVLYWAPAEAYDQWNERRMADKDLKHLLQREKETASEKIAAAAGQKYKDAGGPVGDIHFADSLDGLREAQAEETKGMTKVESDL
jgi:hypothetical protein